MTMVDNLREFVSLICPYCGVRQNRYLDRTARPQVVTCDCEDYPGCDRLFAVRLRMTPKLEYFMMNETPEAKDQTGQRMAEAMKEARA